MSKTVMGAVVAGFMLLLMAACNGTGNDAIARRRAERFGAIPTPAQVATITPTVAAVVERAVGDVQVAVDVDPDGDRVTQLISVALVVIFGIPAFWFISLRKVRSHNGQPKG